MPAAGYLHSADGGGIGEGTTIMVTKSMESVEAGKKADFQGQPLPLNALHGSDEGTLQKLSLGKLMGRW